MDTPISIKEKDIILFKTDNHGREQNQLKNFLLFLHSYGVKRPIKFSHVALTGGLIPNLTVMENILLDSIPNSLKSSKESQLMKYLEKSGNIHLTRLLNKMEGLHQLASEVDHQNLKLASLIKALLKPSKFLFMENPEEHLSTENLEVFKLALKYHIDNSDIITFICTNHEELWPNECNKIVSRGQDGKFQLSYIYRPDSSQHKEAPQPKQPKGHLEIINLPYSRPKKDAA